MQHRISRIHWAPACLAVAALSLAGCQSNRSATEKPAPAPDNSPAQIEQEPTPQPTDPRPTQHVSELEAAQHRLSVAEERLTLIRGAIKRFLNDTPLETLNERTTQAALQVNRLVIEEHELGKSLNALQTTYNQLIEHNNDNQFTPSEQEQAFIEASNEIQEIDRQMRNLRLEVAALRVEHDEDHIEVQKVQAKMAELEDERTTRFDQLAQTLLNAKLRQAALGQLILQEELAKTTEALNEWQAKRQAYVRKMQEYDTLIREQEQAETERELAQQLIADLLESRPK